jgi:predicted RNase H-like HicB family nuclease
MSRYLIVIEETGTGYSAYSPDLPGCVATGATRENVEREMHDAIEFHLDGCVAQGNRFHHLGPKHRTANRAAPERIAFSALSSQRFICR